MSELARAIVHQGRRHLSPLFHVGSVQSLQAGPASLTIAFSGGSVSVAGIRYLASYTPTAGDWVIAIHTGHPGSPGGADWLALGRVAQ